MFTLISVERKEWEVPRDRSEYSTMKYMMFPLSWLESRSQLRPRECSLICYCLVYVRALGETHAVLHGVQVDRGQGGRADPQQHGEAVRQDIVPRYEDEG